MPRDRPPPAYQSQPEYAVRHNGPSGIARHMLLYILGQIDQHRAGPVADTASAKRGTHGGTRNIGITRSTCMLALVMGRVMAHDIGFLKRVSTRADGWARCR